MTRFGFLLSVLLHVVLLGVFMVSLSFKPKPLTLSPKAIPLRALPIKEKTRLPKTQKKKPTKKTVQKKPAPKKSPKKTVSKKVVPKKSSPKKTVNKKVPKKKKGVPKKKQPEKKQSQPPEVPQKELKKEVKKAPKKQEDDDFLSVMKSVEELPTQEVEKQDTQDQDLDSPKSIEDILSLSELDALRQQISSCWRLPAGVRGAGDLVIQLQVTMNPDQTVQSVRLDTDSQGQKSPAFQVAYESAKRALYHPKCVPLKLPKGKFSQWQHFTLLFNPKEMII